MFCMCPTRTRYVWFHRESLMRLGSFIYLRRIELFQLRWIQMIRLSCKLHWNIVPTKYSLSFNMVRYILLVQTSGIQLLDIPLLVIGPMLKISMLTVIYCPNNPLTSGAPNVQLTTRRNRLLNLLMAYGPRHYSTLSTLILLDHLKSNPWDIRSIWYPWLMISLDM